MEIGIRVLSLDPSNETYEKICEPQTGGSAHQITHPGQGFISITHRSTWSEEGSRRVDQLLRSRSRGRDTRADRVDARDLRRLNASVISHASQASSEWCWHWHREDMELPRFRLVWASSWGRFDIWVEESVRRVEVSHVGCCGILRVAFQLSLDIDGEGMG